MTKPYYVFKLPKQEFVLIDEKDYQLIQSILRKYEFQATWTTVFAVNKRQALKKARWLK
jgi:hypothetical protein